jgi:mannose/fructose/N-acetylgalactosamine-specific phosphotransferase system component IIC
VTWAVIGLAGGAAGLDATSFPQVMISRPLIAGALAGWALGDPVAGIILGALHEVFTLSVLPVGAARDPEAGTATVAATGALMLSPATGWAALLVALAFALVWEQVAGRSVLAFRQRVDQLMLPGGAPAPPAGLERRHLAATAFDFLRASVLALAGAALGALVISTLAPRIALPDDAIRTGIAIAAGAALGGSLEVFGGWSERRRSLILGAAAGCVLLLLR